MLEINRQYIILCYSGGCFTSGPYIHNRDHKTSSIITTMNNYYNCYCYYCYCFCCCCRWWYLLLDLLVLWPYSITKCGKCYYKVRQFYYKLGYVLQSATEQGYLFFCCMIKSRNRFHETFLRTSLPANRHPPPATRGKGPPSYSHCVFLSRMKVTSPFLRLWISLNFLKKLYFRK